ncbi:hypothetical protein ACEPAG_7151 [Sanghuangporus baumii]
MDSQHQHLLIIIFKTISLICQTLFYGVYAALIPFSTHFLLRRKTMSKANKLMFSITILMFLLSTMYWVTSIGSEISTLVIFFSSSPDRSTVWSSLFELFNSLLLINYVLTDGIVVWRAWVLCKDGSKKILMVPLFLLFCTSLSVLATVSIRAAMLVIGEKKLKPIIDVIQMVNLEPGGTIGRSESPARRIRTHLLNIGPAGFTRLASASSPWNSWRHLYVCSRSNRWNLSDNCTHPCKPEAVAERGSLFYCGQYVRRGDESIRVHELRSYHEDEDEDEHRSSAESRSEVEKDYSGRLKEKL